LPNKISFSGDSDGEFVASAGSTDDGVNIVRESDSFSVAKELDYTLIVDDSENVFGANRDAVVTALNSDYLNRGITLFEVGVEDPGSDNLSKTTPDKKLQLKVKSDGSGFELVNKPSIIADIGGLASDIGGADDNEVLGWTLSKQFEDQDSTSVYRAAIRPGVNVQAEVSNETYGSDSYVTTVLAVRDITASLILKSGGVINSEAKDIILNPADTYVTSITRLKTNEDTIIGGDIKTASGTNDDIVIDCDGTGRVRFKSEIMPHADQDLVIHSGGTGNMIVKPDLQIGGEIVTGSNDDLVLNPGGTGAIVFQADDIRFEQTSAITGGEIRLNEFNSLGSNYVALRAPISLSADVAFTLPAADGTDGQVLKTNGSGTLSFVDSLSDTTATLKGTTSLKPVGGLDASLAFYDDAGDNFVVLRAPDTLTSDTTFRLPASDGTSGQVMKTDGSGQLSFTTITNGTDGADGADGADGSDGTGFTGGSYNASTGVVTFTSDDGLGFSTADLRGDDGADGTDGTNGTNGIDGADGADGDGFTGGSYNASTGVVTFTSDDGLGFSTGDLRGADGADGTNGTDGADGADGSDALALAGNDQTLTGNRVINTNGYDLSIRDGFSNKLQYDDSADEWVFGAPVRFDESTGGEIKLREPLQGGVSGVVLKAPNANLTSDVEFRLPSADGTSGQFVKTDGSGNLSFGDAGGSTTLTQVYSQSFLDNIGTTKHYLPFKDINEQTTIYQEEAAMFMPFDGKVRSVSIRIPAITGTSGNMTIGVHTINTGNTGLFNSGLWTTEETETVAVATTDDHRSIHFVFDNAQHFEAGDLLTISIQSSTDLFGGTKYVYVSTILDYDTSNTMPSTSQVLSSNP